MKEVTLKEAARLTNRSPYYLRRLAAEGKLKGRIDSLHYGHLWLLDLDALYAYFAPGLPRDTRAEEIRALRADVQQLLSAVQELQKRLPKA